MSAAGNFIELDFPASSDFLALARQVVVTAARADGGFGEERLENLQLAVSEACTNAIRAHSAAGSEAAIHIRCELADGRIEVEVVDRGPASTPRICRPSRRPRTRAASTTRAVSASPSCSCSPTAPRSLRRRSAPRSGSCSTPCRASHRAQPESIPWAAPSDPIDTFAVRADTLPAMASRLVIVESPTKARTIAGFLGDHVRGRVVDGPHPRPAPQRRRRARAVQGRVLGRTRGRRRQRLQAALHRRRRSDASRCSGLKKLVKRRRGAARHRRGSRGRGHRLASARGAARRRVPVRRMVFHEITPQAIRQAIDNPREIDRRLVDAQEARRILDRLYGYEVSPVLWRKVLPACRPAGCRAWRPASWWSASGSACASSRPTTGTSTAPSPPPSRQTLRRPPGRPRRAPRGDRQGLHAPGRASRDDLVVLDEATARSWSTEPRRPALRGRRGRVPALPPPPAAPFITSTLQQEAGRKLRLSSAQAMRAAQSLYERASSPTCGPTPRRCRTGRCRAARAVVVERYGAEYLPDAPRQYTKKVKNAQEAHEAIRPAGEQFRAPEEVARLVGGVEGRLYDLVWRRTVASQMTDAVGETVTVRLEGATAAPVAGPSSRPAAPSSPTRASSGPTSRTTTTTAPRTTTRATRSAASRPSPRATRCRPRSSSPRATPPSRPPLHGGVARQAPRGARGRAGRPPTPRSCRRSRTAATCGRRARRWCPPSRPSPSCGCSEEHFPDLVDYAFTARMEDDLDDIAAGEEEAVPWLSRFYFGPTPAGDGPPAPTAAKAGPARGIAAEGLKLLVSERLDDIDPREVNAIPIGPHPEDGEPIVVRVGRYGPTSATARSRPASPTTCHPTSSPSSKAVELLAAPADDRPLGTDPTTGLVVSVRKGASAPTCSSARTTTGGGKPKRGVAVQGHGPRQPAAGAGARAAALPRVLGEVDGEEVVAQNGRFGPFIKQGKETRSLAERGRPADGRHCPRRWRCWPSPSGAGARAPKPPLPRAGRRPGLRQADGDEGGPLRALRDRRRDERLAPAGRRRRGGHAASGRPSCCQERRDKEAAGLVGRKRSPARARSIASRGVARPPRRRPRRRRRRRSRRRRRRSPRPRRQRRRPRRRRRPAARAAARTAPPGADGELTAVAGHRPALNDPAVHSAGAHDTAAATRRAVHRVRGAGRGRQVARRPRCSPASSGPC